MERKEILLIVLIGVLLLTTAVQSIELIGLSNAQVGVPTPGSATLTTPNPTGSPSPSKQASLENLPSMVGGC